MSKYKIKQTNRFKKELRHAIKSGLKEKDFIYVVNTLRDGNKLPPKYKDHKLSGNWDGYRDCHINPDWILIYKIQEENLILILARTGSHSDLDL